MLVPRRFGHDPLHEYSVCMYVHIYIYVHRYMFFFFFSHSEIYACICYVNLILIHKQGLWEYIFF